MTLKKIIEMIAQCSLPLIFGVGAALIWANQNAQGYNDFVYAKMLGNLDLHFLVNDIFMVFFFALAGAEIVRSFLPGGHLNSLRKAVTPLMATIGGIIGPVGFFFALNAFFGRPEYANGWAITTATDIAISLLFARIVFGSKHPAIAFLLLLAVADDAIGLAIIALFYPDPTHPFMPAWLLLVVGAMALAWLMNKYFKINNYWLYLIFPGVISWLGMYNAQLHPALSLVFIVPFIPHQEIISKWPDECKPSPLAKFEHDFQIWVAFGLFFFGLANAGVEFSNMSDLTYIIFCSFLFGKTLGIYLMSKISVWLGNDMPPGLGDKELVLVGLIASVGLTVALFICNQAYVDLELQDSAKMGALFSLFGCLAAVILGRIVKVERIYSVKG